MVPRQPRPSILRPATVSSRSHSHLLALLDWIVSYDHAVSPMGELVLNQASEPPSRRAALTQTAADGAFPAAATDLFQSQLGNCIGDPAILTWSHCCHEVPERTRKLQLHKSVLSYKDACRGALASATAMSESDEHAHLPLPPALIGSKADAAHACLPHRWGSLESNYRERIVSESHKSF